MNSTKTPVEHLLYAVECRKQADSLITAAAVIDKQVNQMNPKTRSDFARRLALTRERDNMQAAADKLILISLEFSTELNQSALEDSAHD